MLLALLLALFVAPADAGSGALLSQWSFEKNAPGANAVDGAPALAVEKARVVKGREGSALEFLDWSVKDYLKPNPAQATRAVAASGGPEVSLPFRISAWIQPTQAPVYYGGIVEKGQGYGSSFRLVLLRDLRVSASIGDRHVTVRSVEPLSLDQWHEVAMIAEPGALVLMVDGKESARTALESGIAMNSADPLVIGERFTGRIDEVRIARP